MSVMNTGQGVHWTMVLRVFLVVEVFGLTINLPLAMAASVQPFHFPHATALASCMANCALKLDLKHPSDESCGKHSDCDSCVGMCGLLIREPVRRSRSCRDESCAAGCQIACDHNLSHSTRSTHPSHTWNFPHKPSLSLSGRTSLHLTWSKPRPRAMTFKKSAPLLAYILMYRDSPGNWVSFYATFDTKVTTKLPKMTADFRLIAVSARGVATSTVINFKDFPNEGNQDMVTEDESSGELPTEIFPAKTQPPPITFHSLHAHIRRLKSNKFEVVVTWHQESSPGLVDFHIKWVRLECLDKRSAGNCPPSVGQYNSVLQNTRHKRMHVALTGLQLNSRYGLEIIFPTFPSQHLRVLTPHCAHPDATYRTCLTSHHRGHHTPRTTTWTGKTSKHAFTNSPAPDHVQTNNVVVQEESLQPAHNGEDHEKDQKSQRKSVVIAVSLSLALGGAMVYLVVAIFSLYRRCHKTTPERSQTFQKQPTKRTSHNLQPRDENDNNQQSLWATLTQLGHVQHRASTPKKQPKCGPSVSHRQSGHIMPLGRLLSTDLPGSLQFQPISPANSRCSIGREFFTRQSTSQNSIKGSFISPRPNIDSLLTLAKVVKSEEIGNESLIRGENDLRYHLVSIPPSDIDLQEDHTWEVEDPFFGSQVDLDESFSSGFSSENGESFLYWSTHAQGRARKGGISDDIEEVQDDNERKERQEEGEDEEEDHTQEEGDEMIPLRRGSCPTLPTFKSETYVPMRSISSPSVRQDESELYHISSV